MPLTLYYVNATSLAKVNAVQHLHSDLFAHKIKIGLVVESWFTPQHLDNLVINVFFRRDRVRRKGGDVCA